MSFKQPLHEAMGKLDLTLTSKPNLLGVEFKEFRWSLSMPLTSAGELAHALLTNAVPEWKTLRSCELFFSESMEAHYNGTTHECELDDSHLQFARKLSSLFDYNGFYIKVQGYSLTVSRADWTKENITEYRYALSPDRDHYSDSWLWKKICETIS